MKPIFASIALLGVHITRPFHALLMDEKTVYSTLLTAFPKLYDEMTSVSPNTVLTTSNQVFLFVSNEMFKDSLPKPILLEVLETYIHSYSEEIIVLIRILLKMFADGFGHQKGAIFGFGKSAAEDTHKNVAKICTMSPDDINILDINVQIHNIGEERNVGMVNYELSIRRELNLDSVSRKLVLNRSADLIRDNSSSFIKYRKQSKIIKEIQVEWSSKMRDLQKKGYESKEALNIKKDSDKLKDLDYLKNQDIRGPFSTVEEVRAFISSDIAEKNKCDRLYIEIRYAKSTCLSMNTKSLNNFFKLRKKGRKLESHVYAKCLENYFEISRTIENVTIPDLQKTLGEIQNNIFNNNEVVKSVSNQNTGLDLVIGEHIAVFFY